MDCREAKQILMDIVLDEAGARQRALVEEHAQTCAPCRAELANLKLTRSALVRGLPQEEPPRRIAFAAAPAPRARDWFWRRSFTIPAGIAAGIALLIGVLALAQVRLAFESGRWEVAFGGPAVTAVAPSRPAPAPVDVPDDEQSLTREEVAEMVTRAVHESEQRQRALLAAEVRAAAEQLDRRHGASLTALAEQMRYFERTQNIFYKQTEDTQSALQLVASRLAQPQGGTR